MVLSIPFPPLAVVFRKEYLDDEIDEIDRIFQMDESDKKRE